MSKTSPLAYYQLQLTEHSTALKKVNKTSLVYSILRMVVFLSMAIGIYVFRANTSILLSLLIIGIGLFLSLVSRHTNIKREKEKLLALIKINETEMKVLEKDFSHLPNGKEWLDSSHSYSYDVDLFGDSSFFQYLNRTATTAGKERLVSYLLANNINAIEKKQNAIKELAKKPKWRQEFSAIASLLKTDYSTSKILSWIKNYTAFTTSFLRVLPILFFMGTLSVLLLIVFKQLELKYLFFWFFIGLLISGIFLKKVNQLYFNANKAKDIFRQYYQLLLLIESAKFESEFNKENQLKIQSANEKASLIFKRFSSALDALDQRNNMLFGVLANGFALWDLKQSANVEKQMNRYKNNMKHWFDVVSYFDAQNSFANFCFNHPNYVFPKLSSEHLISAEDLGHPLLKEAKRKDNPFSIDKQQFFIITGANMAGKSTFLRTVSLAIIMANCGLPVCAKEFNYQPIKLISSMRTSDSLAEEESYFFSELKRLKQIVSAIEKDTYFIILDEILKGTNSKDKAEGSQQFVQKLVASNSTGIIATHDLSLCALEKNHKEIENYYFDAQIIADELHFDYALKKGICQNMNASFLLRKMGIV